MARPSVKDVARRAGVSLGTVSNVLNRPDSVRPATRERVAQAIAELGFVRNDTARQLRAGDSRTMAYLVLDAANPFFTDVARGIDHAARDAGLTVFLCDSGQQASREDDYLEALLSQRVRGVCITPVDADNPRLRTLVERGVPVVFVDRTPRGQDQDWCSVGVDDLLGGRLAAEHLLATGHTRLAFVGQSSDVTQSVDRLAGARAAVVEGGIGEDLLVLDTEGMQFEDGRDAARRFLELGPAERPTAVFCANDLLALGVLQTFTQHGVAVPDEVALVGYDDIEFAGAAAVPLTSVRQPCQEMGQAAAAALLEEAESASTGQPHEHRHVSFTPELVVRRSSERG
ncbi:Transcriptional regulator of rhamnose utilization, LacI family [Serinicoccus hydrothermalis]|uniref:Transcriptional regulator of rhamnose utilization, LacI family n=1 Tax=Serinicoccus hydrothermalis TaxID=1758689 RepID=A0A1B1NE76_9MICO|nr:LacI family DNA-binding transcriptional regulator [Serinicoccus hydrothermalis]ANS79723.1 Transcriptional regulator of rhamnose utilization, LacI family [Serinicoccus hydrothermalis]